MKQKILNELADEATCLELAGIQSLATIKMFSANSVNPMSHQEMVESITEKVIERLQTTSLSSIGGEHHETVNFASVTYSRGRGVAGGHVIAECNRAIETIDSKAHKTLKHQETVTATPVKVLSICTGLAK